MNSQEPAKANTAIGAAALVSNITGAGNTATGYQALFSNIAENNTANGVQALRNNTTGFQNTATGVGALFSNDDGNNNTAIGFNALSANIISDANTAIGADALEANTSFANTAIGAGALANNVLGNNNTAIGSAALGFNTGFENVAIGAGALSQPNSTGSDNIALGFNAGSNHTTGDHNIYIDNAGVANESVTIRIGASQNRTFIAGIRDVPTGLDAVNVVIDSDGQLGTIVSSRRFKKEIKAMDKASEAILALKPVMFHYKSDTIGTPQFGLIAEEVAAVDPDLVVCDKSGEIYTVRYDAVNAMLLNEFLKEHRKNEEQEKTIAELKSGITALAATVKEQAAQIQKVSAQLEGSKSAPQVVNNP